MTKLRGGIRTAWDSMTRVVARSMTSEGSGIAILGRTRESKTIHRTKSVEVIARVGSE